jgi:hypothetical protein
VTELPSLGRYPGDEPFQVHQRTDGTHYGVAEDGTITEFTDEDVAILELRPLDISICIAAALDLATGEDDGGMDHVHVAGTYEFRGLRCPVCLILTADDNAFIRAVAALAAQNLPTLVLTPTPRRLPAAFKDAAATGILTTAALSDNFVIAESGAWVCTRPPGQLLLRAFAQASGEPPPRDGVRDRNCVIFNGIEHKVELTGREERFLKAAWDGNEIRLDVMIHPKHGLISPKYFNNSRAHRNLVSRFLKDLNRKLQLESTPTLSLSFSLPPRSDAVVRDRFE